MSFRATRASVLVPTVIWITIATRTRRIRSEQEEGRSARRSGLRPAGSGLQIRRGAWNRDEGRPGSYLLPAQNSRFRSVPWRMRGTQEEEHVRLLLALQRRLEEVAEQRDVPEERHLVHLVDGGRSLISPPRITAWPGCR
jgi:hypothetical protein